MLIGSVCDLGARSNRTPEAGIRDFRAAAVSCCTVIGVAIPGTSSRQSLVLRTVQASQAAHGHWDRAVGPKDAVERFAIDQDCAQQRLLRLNIMKGCPDLPDRHRLGWLYPQILPGDRRKSANRSNHAKTFLRSGNALWSRRVMRSSGSIIHTASMPQRPRETW